MPRLIIHFGAQTNTVIIDTPSVIIGRVLDCDIPLDDSKVSRQHARIGNEDDSWILTDLDSRNGTAVNGRRIEHCTLIPGDRIQIGSATLYFESDRAAHQRNTGTDLDLPEAELAHPTPIGGSPTSLFLLTDSNGNAQQFDIPYSRLLEGIVIGRARDNDISIPDDGVSSRHLRISIIDESYFVTDLGSTNGTYLNGKLASGGILKTGDRIGMGEVTIDFYADAAEATFDQDSFMNLEGFLVKDRPTPTPARLTQVRRLVPVIVGGLAAMLIASILILALSTRNHPAQAAPINLLADAAALHNPAILNQHWRLERHEGGTPSVQATGGAVRITFSGKSVGPQQIRLLAAKPIPINAHRTYQFSGAVRTHGLTGAAAVCLLWIDQSDPTNSTGRSIGMAQSPAITDGDAWQQVTVTARPPAEATALLPMLCAAGSAGAFEFREPALLALSGTSRKTREMVIDSSGVRLHLSPTGQAQVTNEDRSLELLRDLSLVAFNEEGQIVYSQAFASSEPLVKVGQRVQISGTLFSLAEADQSVAFDLIAKSQDTEIQISATVRGAHRETPLRWAWVARLPASVSANDFELFDGTTVRSLNSRGQRTREAIIRRPGSRYSLRFDQETQLHRIDTDPTAPPIRLFDLYTDSPFLIIEPAAPEDGQLGYAFALSISGTQSPLDDHLDQELDRINHLITQAKLTQATRACDKLETAFHLCRWVQPEVTRLRKQIAAEEQQLHDEAETAFRNAMTYGTPDDFDQALALYQTMIARLQPGKEKTAARAAVFKLKSVQQSAPWQAVSRKTLLTALAKQFRDFGADAIARLVEDHRDAYRNKTSRR